MDRLTDFQLKLLHVEGLPLEGFLMLFLGHFAFEIADRLNEIIMKKNHLGSFYNTSMRYHMKINKEEEAYVVNKDYQRSRSNFYWQ